MISPPPVTTSSTTAMESETTTTFSKLHPDIIETHILPRLDGPTLASANCTSTTLRHLSSQDCLWSDICHATWPSTNNTRVNHIMSTFSDGGGPRAFFGHAYPLIPSIDTMLSHHSKRTSSTTLELISAVDIHYKTRLIFTKVQETETVTGWFQCSPFRIDLLEPKDVVPTTVKLPNGEEKDTCTTLMSDMSLSWILIDPNQRLAVNLSSHKPVSVHRHWLTGEVQARFASIEKGASSGHVQLGIVVTCGWSEGGEMLVKEVSLEAEDLDGKQLNGKDSLAILQRALEGKGRKGINGRRKVEIVGRERYEKYLRMKQQKIERRLKLEGALDVICVAFVVLIFVAFWCFLICR